MARVLIVGGGCRGRRLARALVAERHVVRISTRSEAARERIEAAGAECWIGTPDRLATMRPALDGVAILCWLMATAAGGEQELAALHGSRLQFFLTQAIDTTVRGFVYEARAAGTPPAMLARGEELARELAARNAIPAAFVRADQRDLRAWLADIGGAIATLLDRQ